MTRSSRFHAAVYSMLLTGILVLPSPVRAWITNQTASIVIGQSLFTNGAVNQGASIGSNTLNGPYGVFCNGTKVFVADVNSNRVLIFNSIPSSNNPNADVVVGQSLMSGGTANQGGVAAANTMNAPYAVIVVGTKLLVAEGTNNRILIFNTIPTSNNASADVVIGQPNFSSTAVNQGGPAAANTLNKPIGLYSDGTKLFVSDNMNNRLLIFNSIPTANNASADVVVGQTTMAGQNNNQGGSVAANTLYYPSNALVVSGKLLIADSFNARILIYNSVPSTNNASADVVIGQANMSGSSINQGGSIGANTNGRANGMWSDGTKLFISDQANNRILIYNSIPTANNASANIALGQTSLATGLANQGGAISANGCNAPYNVTGFGSKLFFSDISNNRVLIFNDLPSACLGAYSSQWGGSGTGNGQFNLPNGVAVDTSGNVYVADILNHLIQKFTSSGSFINQWGGLGSGNGQFNRPIQLVIGQSGDVYVSDLNNNRIQEFTSSGAYVTQWGGLNQSAQINVDSSGNLYVADSGNNRIVEFTSSGSIVTSWGSLGSGPGQFTAPWGVVLDSSNNVYVGDSNQRIQKFTSSGTFITQWGSSGSGNGQFNDINGLAMDSSNQLYAADRLNNRIQEFDSSGNYLTQLGSAGSGNGQFNGPRGVVVDNLGNVYVADESNNRIQKFGCTVATATPTITPSVTPAYSPTASIPDPGDVPYVYPQPFKCGDNVAVKMHKPGRVKVSMLSNRGNVEAANEFNFGPGVNGARFDCGGLGKGLKFMLVEITYNDGEKVRLKPVKIAVTQ